jgi:hypothetical protein
MRSQARLECRGRMRSQLRSKSDQMGSQLKLGSRVLNFCRLSMMTRYTLFVKVARPRVCAPLLLLPSAEGNIDT